MGKKWTAAQHRNFRRTMAKKYGKAVKVSSIPTPLIGRDDEAKASKVSDYELGVQHGERNERHRSENACAIAAANSQLALLRALGHFLSSLGESR